MVEFTDNVEQLIRETDEAFKAVGFALGDAKTATRGWQQHDSIRQSRSFNGNKNNIAITRTNSVHSKRPPGGRDIVLKSSMKSFQEQPPSSGSSGKSPVPKSIVASKTKKTNAPKQKKHLSSPKPSRKSLPHPHTSARWNLGDVTASMADVFTGKMFSKLEVDEMLTPDRRQQLEEKAKLENERKASIETAQSAEAAKDVEEISPIERSHERSHELDGNQIFEVESTSPSEPFHLENLLPRFNNSDPSQKSNSADLDTAVSGAFEIPEKSQQTARKPLPDLPGLNDLDIDAIEQAFEDLNFPSPPRDSPPRVPRSRSNTGATNLLPTIPEININNTTSGHSPKRSLSQDSDYSQDSQASSMNDYVELPSTPFTLTSPLFRHGKIRLEQVYRNNRDSITGPEDLDWTAFQMAISGTMDDGGLGMEEENIWEADEAELDGILDWWTGFGYQGIGRMVNEAPPSRRKTRKMTLEREQRKNGEIGRENAVAGLGIKTSGSGFNNNGLWFNQIQDHKDDSNNEHYHSTPRPQTPTHLKPKPSQMQRTPITPPANQNPRRDVNLQVDITKSMQQHDDDDDDSLPPSPINLVKIKDEYIPMGYNLGHDLGDFLNWETYHVQSLFGDEEPRGYI